MLTALKRLCHRSTFGLKEFVHIYVNSLTKKQSRYFGFQVGKWDIDLFKSSLAFGWSVNGRIAILSFFFLGNISQIY
jgi:hypothetical protein